MQHWAQIALPDMLTVFLPYLSSEANSMGRRMPACRKAGAKLYSMVALCSMRSVFLIPLLLHLAPYESCFQ